MTMGAFPYLEVGCFGGWRRLSHDPVTASHIGIHSDGFVMRCGSEWLMWYTQDENGKIYTAKSADGLEWMLRKVGNHSFSHSEGDLVDAVPRRADLGWAALTGSPWVVKDENGCRMYFCGTSRLKEENPGKVIGMAESPDGLSWTVRPDCVLMPEFEDEENSVSHPCVIKNEKYEMWYVAGGQDRASVIRYASSEDGINWQKYDKPVIAPSGKHDKWGAGAACVLYMDGWYYLAYTAWEDAVKSRICLARSENGRDGWQFYKENPVLNGGIAGTWDVEGVESPCIVKTDTGFRMYYTGRRSGQKAIGVVVLDRDSLGNEEDWK